MANAQHMFVVTGGPGSGKSSLIDAMTRRGFRTMPDPQAISSKTGDEAREGCRIVVVRNRRRPAVKNALP